MTERFAYDEVPYDTEANPEAHPRSMGTLARLFGLATRAPSTARMLEIGCGDGEDLIAAAAYLPRATFAGFDLSAEAVARGQASAHDAGTRNVQLAHRDVRDVLAAGLEPASFDYVVAHGVYSWVPEAIRGDVLAVMRRALAPGGVGFVSVNALPGWEPRRALRILMREASAEAEAPGDKVRLALALVDDLASARGEGFVGILARAAEEYRAHVTQATPPDAPFSRYVFHDLLAECNDPFSVEELDARLRAAGLRIVCETPLARGRAKDWPGLAADMARSGSPFLQVLVCRDDEEVSSEPDIDAVRGMHLWADLAHHATGAYRTTTGAVLRAAAGSAIARAAASAPGFVAVSTLADDATLSALTRDLFAAACEGILSVAVEPPPLGGAAGPPRVTSHVRLRARQAIERNASTAVLTSALHRSFRVPRTELAVVRELDGTAGEDELAARSGVSVETVRTVIDRYARHGFLVREGT